MIKVSVIVPVYNVEKYLDKCLSSLVNQTLKDIEIIVVNDGTKDNSQKIIDKYKKRYPKIIKSYIKENGGLSDARNYGLKYASGEYISFVDSDDYIDSNMLEEMYEKAVDGNFDIVMCDLNYIYETETKYCSCNIKSDLLSKQEIKKNMINIYPTAWNKIYKKELIKDFLFKKGVWYEDVEFMYRILPSTNSIGVINKPFYQYVQRDGAITSTFNDKIFDHIGNFNGVIKYYKDKNIFDEYHSELEYLYVRYLYATMLKGLAKTKNKEKLLNGYELAKNNILDIFPNYKKNKYLQCFSFKNIYLKNMNKFFLNIIWFINNK